MGVEHIRLLYREDGTLREQYVYMLVCEDSGGSFYVKVGRTICPDQRISSLLIGCPIRPVQFAYAPVNPPNLVARVERQMHLELKGNALRGEWFKADSAEPLKSEAFRAAIHSAFSKNGLAIANWSVADMQAYRQQVESHRRFMGRLKRKEKREKTARLRAMAPIKPKTNLHWAQRSKENAALRSEAKNFILNLRGKVAP